MTTRGLSKALLVYDGDCAFCALWVGRLQRTLQTFPRVTTSAEADTEELGLSATDIRDYVWLITPTRTWRVRPRFLACFAASGGGGGVFWATCWIRGRFRLWPIWATD
ncbi:hypothetical protein [Pontimonas sp.]|uniref:hypothetical protein n=1 Tax=Pontimonas sp. TaxID=2304492 RepID=UPI00286FB8AC|nr:hypothetical protein [Pontimonas sp.]MDR9435039.1 hypothetical protein [Pontimonas sp.]